MRIRQRRRLHGDRAERWKPLPGCAKRQTRDMRASDLTTDARIAVAGDSPSVESTGPNVSPRSMTTASARMSRQRRRDTAPELLLRRALHATGYRYRVTYPVPGMARRTIDVAFTRQRKAVFVDGCFWHGCPVHGTSPTANADVWCAKIDRNRGRDGETTMHLQDLGWRVLRVWEHDLGPGGCGVQLVRRFVASCR